MQTKIKNPKRVSVITLGCSKNIYDSEVLMGQLNAGGVMLDKENKAKTIIINTCGFIDRAKEESINTIVHYANQKEQGKINNLYVTGCLSERYMDDLKKEIPNVNQYFGTNHLPDLLKAVGVDYKHNLVGERLLTTPKGYAYLKISEGCNRPCSFCAIPLMRGRHISKPIENIVSEAEMLVEKGVKELILIAQDSTYYGLDLYKERKLAVLLRKLAKVKGIEWIRLHYAFPTGFPMDVIDVMAEEPKICNYLDIPLQHISDDILKSMKRRTSKSKTEKLLTTLRERIPNLAIRTTFIIGYPNETEQDFEMLKSWMQKMKFERLGCFTYSHEEQTTAYRLTDNIPQAVKEQRVSEIMDFQADISYELNTSKIGKTLRCIVENKEGNYYIGRTEHDSPEIDNEVIIDAKSSELELGEFYNVKIHACDDFDLKGTLVL